MVGILGGFTTFSAFGNETINMMREGDRALAGLNVLSQVTLGLGAVWAGRAVVGFLGR
jgi:CrcB protein